MGVFLWIEMSPALSGGFKATNGYKINNDLEGYQDSLDIYYRFEEDKALGFSQDNWRISASYSCNLCFLFVILNESSSEDSLCI
ncbi:MAG TPA: hypothetical protein VKN82_03850 [Desulfohalobiaceae bacterium]|nr:hypothetical protein [Desulfohalobiaceae bacterium]